MDWLHWILAAVAIVFALLFYRTRYLAGQWKKEAEIAEHTAARYSARYEECAKVIKREQDLYESLRKRMADVLINRGPEA